MHCSIVFHLLQCTEFLRTERKKWIVWRYRPNIKKTTSEHNQKQQHSHILLHSSSFYIQLLLPNSTTTQHKPTLRSSSYFFFFSHHLSSPLSSPLLSYYYFFYYQVLASIAQQKNCSIPLDCFTLIRQNFLAIKASPFNSSNREIIDGRTHNHWLLNCSKWGCLQVARCDWPVFVTLFSLQVHRQENRSQEEVLPMRPQTVI